jgi:hypothetical protein
LQKWLDSQNHGWLTDLPVDRANLKRIRLVIWRGAEGGCPSLTTPRATRRELPDPDIRRQSIAKPTSALSQHRKIKTCNIGRHPGWPRWRRRIRPVPPRTTRLEADGRPSATNLKFCLEDRVRPNHLRWRIVLDRRGVENVATGTLARTVLLQTLDARASLRGARLMADRQRRGFRRTAIVKHRSRWVSQELNPSYGLSNGGLR